jgi:tRNA 2-selenouridine synthase
MQALGAKVVDLEGLAHHKGSSFGALGEAPQPSSEAFENILFAALRRIPEGEEVWLEDESRMIGHVYLPDEFYNRLTAAPVVMLEQPMAWRINHLVEHYARYPKSALAEAFTRIKKRLGGQHLKAALQALDVDDFATAAEIALVYYDKAYAHYGARRNARVFCRVQAVSPGAEGIARQVLLKAGR